MELPENYYFSNFHALTSFVHDCYEELLNETELQWYRSLCSASESAQRLYIRLLGRRGELFRLSKLKYSEIEKIADAVTELNTLSLLQSNGVEDSMDLLPLYTKPELSKIFDIKSAAISRAELVQKITTDMTDEQRSILQKKDTHIRIMNRAEFDVFKLCFFGNLYQDLSEFVLSDLGVQSYENYPITKTSRAFSSRAQIDANLQYYRCSAVYDQLDLNSTDDLLALDKLLPATIFKESDPHLIRRVERLRNRIARQLERIHANSSAFSLYAKTNRPPSRERRVRLLAKLEQHQDALQLCEQMIASPIDEEEIQFTEIFLPKLRKSLGMSPVKKTSFRPNTTKLTLKRADSRVELAAREFYSQFGSCFYTENTLINGVLGLFIWDIVFAPVPNAFFNPFQSFPADFYEPSFTRLREAELQARLALLDDEMSFTAEVWSCFEKKQGIANPLVNWSWLSEELLQLALVRIPAADFRILFNRILDDLRNNSSGLPDLILFQRTGGYEFIEIKGPGDVVQKNQKRWMQYFYEHRIPYRVVNVRWSGSES